jgi:hypothetical protein
LIAGYLARKLIRSLHKNTHVSTWPLGDKWDSRQCPMQNCSRVAGFTFHVCLLWTKLVLPGAREASKTPIIMCWVKRCGRCGIIHRLGKGKSSHNNGQLYIYICIQLWYRFILKQAQL